MARVYEVIFWASPTTGEDDFKAWAQLPAGPNAADARLESWLNWASVKADQIIDREFKEQLDGDDPGPPPIPTGPDIDWINMIQHDGIKAFVYSVTAVLLEVNGRPFGLTSARTRDISKSYAIGSRIKGGEVKPIDVSRTFCDFLSPSMTAFT